MGKNERPNFMSSFRHVYLTHSVPVVVFIVVFFFAQHAATFQPTSYFLHYSFIGFFFFCLAHVLDAFFHIFPSFNCDTKMFQFHLYLCGQTNERFASATSGSFSLTLTLSGIFIAEVSANRLRKNLEQVCLTHNKKDSLKL